MINKENNVIRNSIQHCFVFFYKKNNKVKRKKINFMTAKNKILFFYIFAKVKLNFKLWEYILQRF